MYTQEQLDAIEQTAKMIGGVLMELDDPTGVGAIKCDLLDQVYQRLAGLQRLCNDVVASAEEGIV